MQRHRCLKTMPCLRTSDFCSRGPIHEASMYNRVGLGSIDSISTWFGMLVSISLRCSGPKTHAGPSFLLRERFGFDRFDNISISI